MSISVRFVSHHVHCGADVFGFIVWIPAMCSDEYDVLLLSHLKLREWATAMMIAP
jgi:hypothetical protein